ncbi:MAG: exodeoxyribonuclease VII large subunit [Paludibacteraceae bacterium]|nr:exodeoxyribonuclease VII large subunit [Paludibacteraceae bacterium]
MTPYTLTQLTAYIDQSLAILSSQTFWVRAEIASLSSKNGHGYFELVEKAANGQLAAKMRATCWSNLYPMLSAYFEQETGQRLQAGMQVLVEVEVSFHAIYSLSLNIRNIDPTFTVGDLARQRQETIRRLQKEGLTELQQELRLPTLPLRLAVVSSEQAAGYGDFVDELGKEDFAFRVQLFPAIMQGERAERSIIEALQTIDGYAEQFDAVILIRGGGATTDLGCFDSYHLASACARCKLPILSGIGHTRDVSIVDMVVFQPLKTPTAVAGFLIERLQVQSERLQRLRMRLQKTAEIQVLVRRHRIEMLRQRLAACSPDRIYKMGYSLATYKGRPLSSVGDVPVGSVFETHLSDGTMSAIRQA